MDEPREPPAGGDPDCRVGGMADGTSDSGGPDIPGGEIVRAELAELPAFEAQPAPRQGRRVKLPAILFCLTALSTWFAGATGFNPFLVFSHCGDEGTWMPLRRAILRGWDEGLIYAACIMGILLAHEMGHFVYTLIYRVRASLPFFLPLPIAPTGTMGAVIAMDGRKANRPQTFDIGIAGPLAGLAVIVPVAWYGIVTLDLTQPPAGGIGLHLPLVLRWGIDAVHPGKLPESGLVFVSQANPWFFAGWLGLLVTALNMFPVSQLDGGHVTYTLWGRSAHWFARGVMVFIFAYMVYTGDPTGLLMAILVMLIGTDHPPTADDTAPIGLFRFVLGHASLVIPILCFPPRVLELPPFG